MQIDHHSNTQDGCPHVVKGPATMWTQDGHHKMASSGGQLGGTRPAREGSWGQSGLQGRAILGGGGFALVFLHNVIFLRLYYL